MTSTTRTRSMTKRPTDLSARERLRDAQAAETRAVSAYYAAAESLAAIEANAADAEAKLDAARAGVVSVSGLERASTLLGEKTAVLRRAAAAQPDASDPAGATAS